MKIALFFGILASLFGMVACSADGYVINGEIAGEEGEGKTVYLVKGRGMEKKVLDSTVIKNGHFRFEGEMVEPVLCSLVFFPDETRSEVVRTGYIFRPIIPVFVDKGKIEIAAEWGRIPKENLRLGYDYSTLKIEAPAIMRDYMAYASKVKVLNEAEGKAQLAYRLYLNRKEENKISEGIALVDRIDAMTAKTKEFLKEFIKEKSGSVVGLCAFHENLSCFTAQEIEELLLAFSPEVTGCDYGKKVLAEAASIKQTAVGAKYVDNLFQTLDGNTYRLSEVLGKGKYVILECWGTTCAPCKADIPHLKEVYELYQPDGLEIVGIAVDTDKVRWQKEVERLQMPWLQLSDLKGHKGEFCNNYRVRSVPVCLMVAPDGTIIDRDMRNSRLYRKVIELYGNKFGDKY